MILNQSAGERNIAPPCLGSRYTLAKEVPAGLYAESRVPRSAYNPLSMTVEGPRTRMARRVLLEQ